MVNQIIKLNQVKQLTALSRSSIYRKASEGTFPKPIKLGERSSGWLQSEVNKWVEDCVYLSRKGGAV